MGIFESELHEALNPAVKRKGNRTGKLRLQAARVAGGCAEVMVKITSFGKGAGHVQAHLDYVTRKGKLQIENDRQEVFKGKRQIQAFFADWEKDFGDSKRHKNQRDSMHVVLSMPEGTDQESLKRAVREFAKGTFGKNHEYAFVLHTDELHPHCHLAVKCLGFDGVRLNPRKADLQQWREGFAERLRDQGVDAEATARRSRGVVRKAEPAVIRHIEQGDKTHQPRISKVRAAKVKESARELTAQGHGLPVPVRPWEEAIKTRQHDIRRAWLAAAAELEREDTWKSFNQKEARNERPNYDRITPASARPGQRAAALYQSHLEKTGRPAAPGTLSSLRNLSSSRVVHDSRATEVLLQPHAFDRVGPRGGTDPGMRRAGTGADRAYGSSGQLGDRLGALENNKAFAARIRGFVEGMPGIDTERHQVRQALARRFAKEVVKVPGDPVRSPVPGGIGGKPGAVSKSVER
jgi:type IV secretory pathway VirD2 relaxase